MDFWNLKKNAKDEKRENLKLFLNKPKSGNLFKKWGCGNYFLK